MNAAETIGQRIREVRGRLSQAEFSSRLAVHKETLGKYERDERSPDSDFLIRLGREFKVSLDWLLTGEVASALPQAPDIEGVATKLEALVDTGLIATIQDKVAKTYKEIGAAIAPKELGRVCAEIYNELVLANPDDPTERLIALGARIEELRRDLRSPIDGDGTSKQVG